MRKMISTNGIYHVLGNHELAQLIKHCKNKQEFIDAIEQSIDRSHGDTKLRNEIDHAVKKSSGSLHQTMSSTDGKTPQERLEHEMKAIEDQKKIIVNYLHIIEERERILEREHNRIISKERELMHEESQLEQEEEKDVAEEEKLFTVENKLSNKELDLEKKRFHQIEHAYQELPLEEKKPFFQRLFRKRKATEKPR